MTTESRNGYVFMSSASAGIGTFLHIGSFWVAIAVWIAVYCALAIVADIGERVAKGPYR